MSGAGWETFRDSAYFDMWCVREVGQRTFGQGFHLVNGSEAQGLTDLLNSLAIVAATGTAKTLQAAECEASQSVIAQTLPEESPMIPTPKDTVSDAMVFAGLKAALHDGETVPAYVARKMYLAMKALDATLTHDLVPSDGEVEKLIAVALRNLADGDAQMLRENLVCMSFYNEHRRLPNWDELKAEWERLTSLPAPIEEN